MTEPAAPAPLPEPQLPEQPRVDLAPRRRMGWITRILVAGGSLGTVMGVGLALLFGSYKQPSGSMWPTMTVGERFFVNRLAKEPARGAVVVFRYPEHRASVFTKRVVGLAGDVVSIENGELSINGWKVPRCTVGRATYYDVDAPGESGKHEGTLFLEYLGAGSHLVFDEKTSYGALGDGHEWKVAPGQYFVLGDNRNNSHDSRMWYGGAGGGVPLGDTLGREVGHEQAALPKGAEDLGPALAACLEKRPDRTEPPPPK